MEVSNTNINANTKSRIVDLTASKVTNQDYSIVYLKFKFQNQKPVNFFVPGNHNYEIDNEVNFFIPNRKENEFRDTMRTAPLVAKKVTFHGMDSKPIGYYKADRVNNNGGGTLYCNVSNPVTMTELNNRCFVLHQENKIYHYILDTLDFYKNICTKEMMNKALLQDLNNVVSQTNCQVHLYVDPNFLTINGKSNEFSSIWIDHMQSKGYTIHKCENKILGAIQYVFGIKTPETDVNINEYIQFDTTSNVEYSYSSNLEISTIARSEGRISFQTNSDSQNDVQIISIVKGRVNCVTFLDQTVEIENISENQADLMPFYQTIFQNLEIVFNNLEQVVNMSSQEKNKLLIDNSEIIVKASYCNPKSISNDDSPTELQLLNSLYNFSNTRLLQFVSSISNVQPTKKQNFMTLNRNSSTAINNLEGMQPSLGLPTAYQRY